MISMSDEPKKNNKHVMRYEQIYQKLAKVTNVYLKLGNIEKFKYFITSERGMNKTGLNNLLIEIPEDNIMNIIKEQYIKEPNNEGEIGTIEPEKQAEEIRNMALLMLISNRLSKEYKDRLAKNRVADEVMRAKYEKNEKDLLRWKNNAQTDLMASLYILRKTGGKEYEDYFSYGDYKEKEGESTAFVIDLPYMGQICVHYGMEKRNNIEEAKEKVIAILERKRALGQIGKNEFKKLKEGITIKDLLPTYEGKLYEHSSTLPIEYIGNTAKDKIEEMQLADKLPEEVEKQHIQKMIESGLNEREAYYLAIRLGFPKKQLKQVIKAYGERTVKEEEKIGRKAVRMTTAQERENTLKYQQKTLKSYRDGKDNKEVG